MSGIELTPLAQLPHTDRETWRVLAEGPRSSPFSRLEWVLAVDAARGTAPVEVLIERAPDGVARTFLPFQRDGRRAVGPGRPLADYHGAIGDTPDDLRPFVERAGVDALAFDHVPLSQTGFARWATGVDLSPRIDLRESAADPWDERRFHRVLDRKHRQLTRRRGDVTFTVDDDDDALDALIAWKSDQYRRTGKRDLFAQRWVRDVLAALRAGGASTAPRRVLSTLRAGGEPVAAHLGLVAGAEWHYWFPAYDPAEGSASPGMLLLREMCRSAASLGADVIDLGRGTQPYKRELANAQTLVIEGVVPSARLAPRARRVAGSARRAVRVATRRRRT